MPNDLTDKIPPGDAYRWVARRMAREGISEDRILAGMAFHRVLTAVGFDLSVATQWPRVSFPRSPTEKHAEAWHDGVRPTVKEYPELRALALEVAERIHEDKAHFRHGVISAHEMVQKYGSLAPPSSPRDGQP